jgi:hypothetical protein
MRTTAPPCASCKATRRGPGIVGGPFCDTRRATMPQDVPELIRHAPTTTRRAAVIQRITAARGPAQVATALAKGRYRFTLMLNLHSAYAHGMASAECREVCMRKYVMSSRTRWARFIVVLSGAVLFAALVVVWFQAEGTTKTNSGVCPPGRVIGEPTLVMATRGLVPPPTPLNPNLVSPLNPQRSAPKAVVFSLTQTIDLAPGLADDDKGKLYVCKKTGEYVVFLVRPGTPIGDLPLEKGDVLFLDEPPIGARRVAPPIPTMNAPPPINPRPTSTQARP